MDFELTASMMCPFQKADMVHCKGFSNIHLLDNMKLVENDIQINHLLGYADALISDYSSAAVDYLVLDRPIAFTLDDVEEYNNSRGFVFDNIREWLPGEGDLRL
jgi:CDP-glycerol glycerophosphotransferase (TagB/SpsB family)